MENKISLQALLNQGTSELFLLDTLTLLVYTTSLEGWNL